MINTDYPIESLSILLCEDCLTAKYHSLVSIRESLLAELKGLGCVTKRDAEKLTDEQLTAIMQYDAEKVTLFRRFLSLYDPSPAKFKEIEKLTSEPEEQAAFLELYHLPGVRYTRANLYYLSGYRTLQELSRASVEEVLEKTAEAISAHGLSYIVPLPKEVRTHIAVSKAFCGNTEKN